ncbi:alcohol dehydrogenase catalytic domain-containing protein [Burkholderia sp. MSMB1498]|uniref:alcohol dehydrogenase catalytic domain-containing protein n=1 Tax=Burkholderia sp. MSMB1498 TaxID=1637842 RepID=UPI000756DA64|nr:hypothetical protein [Burkholderia sp. MSMB1498]KVK83802.1 hypothetical protein WS91_05960 [Burkholderia sp. MSMB1498]
MKAYVIERFGGPDVLQLQDVPMRNPGDDEIRIRVRAFGLDRAEMYLRSGNLGPIGDQPRVPGVEAVGEVLHDPAGQRRTGQAVATAMGGLPFTRPGSYAEQVTVLRGNVVAVDDSALSWEALAALPQAYVTAAGALDKVLAICSGQTLLIRGGTPSVALAAIAHAKYRCVTVIATNRAQAHFQRMRDVGADLALVDGGQIAATVKEVVPSGVDVVREGVGASPLRDSIGIRSLDVRPTGSPERHAMHAARVTAIFRQHRNGAGQFARLSSLRSCDRHSRRKQLSRSAAQRMPPTPIPFGLSGFLSKRMAQAGRCHSSTCPNSRIRSV